MVNPQASEMMVDGIQAERRNAAKMNSLIMASRGSRPTLKEIAYNFIISMGRKMKGQLQVKPGIQQPQGQVEMYIGQRSG